VHPFCRQCGDPVDGAVEGAYTCSWCTRTKPRFDAARSAVRYRGGLRHAIHALKYQNAMCVATDLVPLLEACVRTQYPRVRFDAVVPVPLYPRRERERSYNQSDVLSQGLARALGIQAFSRCLRRVRPTATQTNLSAHQRKVNVRNAFAVANAEWVEGRTLLLVDDVMTTGATVNECSRMLKRAGGAGVYVATVARG
jgi:ComF family protein